MKRPFGVKIIILLQLINAGVFTLFVAMIYSWNFEWEALSNFETETYIVANFLVSMLGLVVAFGLWRLRRWAWIMVMALLGLSMGLDLLAYINGEPNYFNMFVNIVQVFYLNQRDVQVAFRHRSGGLARVRKNLIAAVEEQQA